MGVKDIISYDVIIKYVTVVLIRRWPYKDRKGTVTCDDDDGRVRYQTSSS